MNEMFVLRRANGEIFTEQRDGKLTIPTWSSKETLARYKERNPELMIFLPTPLTRSLIKKPGSGVPVGAVEFFLLSENDPNAELDNGKPISLEQIFAANEQGEQLV